MNINLDIQQSQTRRHFFRDCGVGLGKIALASLLTDDLARPGFSAPVSQASPFAPKPAHFPAQADFSFLAPCPASGLIVHGDKDEVVPQASVDKLAQKLQNQKNISIDYRTISGADHFFQNHMKKLDDNITDYLDQMLAPKAA